MYLFHFNQLITILVRHVTFYTITTKALFKIIQINYFRDISRCWQNIWVKLSCKSAITLSTAALLKLSTFFQIFQSSSFSLSFLNFFNFIPYFQFYNFNIFHHYFPIDTPSLSSQIQILLSSQRLVDSNSSFFSVFGRFKFFFLLSIW